MQEELGLKEKLEWLGLLGEDLPPTGIHCSGLHWLIVLPCSCDL